jgi:hypothetical protein
VHKSKSVNGQWRLLALFVPKFGNIGNYRLVPIARRTRRAVTMNTNKNLKLIDGGASGGNVFEAIFSAEPEK